MSKPGQGPSYAEEVMVVVAVKYKRNDDDPDRHMMRAMVTADTGFERVPKPDITVAEMQEVAFAAKMALINVIQKRKKRNR